MKGKTEYKRELSPVGEVLHDIQLKCKDSKMRYDTQITKTNHKVSPTMVSRVRYGLQCPTPIFIKAIIDTYHPEGSVIKALLKAMYIMLASVWQIRISKDTAMQNIAASEALEEMHDKISPLSKMKAFAAKWLNGVRKVLKNICNALKWWATGHLISGRAYVRINVNA